MNDTFSNVPIDFDLIPQADEIEFRPLEKKYLIVKIIKDCLFWVLLIIAAILLPYFLPREAYLIVEYLPYAIIALVVFILITIIMDVLGFKWKGYIVREKDIIYRSGLIFRSIVHIPFNRVQHCEVNQGVIDRYLDLAKIKVYTAGGNKSDLLIPGLPNQEAMNLKSFILNKTGEDETI